MVPMGGPRPWNRESTMRLRAVRNKRLGVWRICHDQWCLPGETSTVATMTSMDFGEKDERMARLLCSRFNAGAELLEDPLGASADDRLLNAVELCRRAFSSMDGDDPESREAAMKEARTALARLADAPAGPGPARLVDRSRVPVSEDELSARGYRPFRDPRKEGDSYLGSWQRDFDDERGKRYSLFVSLWSFDGGPVRAQADAQFSTGDDTSGDACNVSHSLEGGLEEMEIFYDRLWRRMGFGHYEVSTPSRHAEASPVGTTRT